MANRMKLDPTYGLYKRGQILEDIECNAKFLESKSNRYVVHDGKAHENLRDGIYYQGDLIHCISYCKVYYAHNGKWPFFEPKEQYEKQIKDLKKLRKHRIFRKYDD